MAQRIRTHLHANTTALLLWVTTAALNADGDDRATISAGKSKVVVFYGVYTQWYRFDQALANHNLKVCNAHTQGVQDFPPPEEMDQAGVLILSDVGGAEFKEQQVKQIKSFIERGGGLLVMGGPFTLGLGQFTDKGISELLPVELSDFDLKWEKQGMSFARSAESAILQRVDLASNPVVYWIHKVKPKEGSQVLLTAGDYPLLITGTYGKGRVAVFTGTPMGLPEQGQTPFWEWGGWSALVRNLVGYLATPEGVR